MMTILTRASDRQTVSLGNKIASSGEGEVWKTNFSGILAKIYHNPTPERIEKLKAMLANPPVDPMKSKNHISIAFPQDLLQDGSGNYVGFLMPGVPSSRELPSIYNPRLRKRNAPGFNWYYLHVTALNTAWIIQAIHEKGYVLGDIKPQNILVNDRALVAVIDTDSFQVRDSKTGKVYRCTVGSDGFTPVELLGKDFFVTDQSEVCDRFRLAVLIHYLLFGYHPFSGEWTGTGESPDQTELIRKGLWYGGNNSLIRPSRTTISLDVVHPGIKQLFLKCFNEGHASPKLRPTAEDWHHALQVAVNDLAACNKIDSHHYSRTYGKCYWCERSVKLSVDIFPGNVITSSTAAKTTTPSTVIQTVSSSIPSQTPIKKPTYNLLPILSKILSNKQKIIVISSLSVICISILSALLTVKQEPHYVEQSTELPPPSPIEQQETSAPDNTETFKSQEEIPKEPRYEYKPAPLESSISQSNQQFSQSDFPKSSCGDPLPIDSTDYPLSFYPVYLPYSDENLDRVRLRFCQDSIKKRRENGELSVQVSSFTSREKAISFAQFISSEFENAIVGEPTLIETDPITAARLKRKERQIDKLANKLFYNRHPELAERKIESDETDLAQEWHQIRQCLVDKNSTTSLDECS